MDNPTDNPVLHVPARDIPTPTFLSPQAQAILNYSSLSESPAYPALGDREGWHRYVKTLDALMLPMMTAMAPKSDVSVVVRKVGNIDMFDIRPSNVDPNDRSIVLDMHGGGLILCGGELCRLMGTATAATLQRRVWCPDYRMPPDHPYPAALDDGIEVYKLLLKERSPQEIIVSGASAGGNLAAALVLRARDSGLPMPAGLYLATPELDLTESGDSFHTNRGVDRLLQSLMPVNVLYANGQDLAHPYLSPLFADFHKGFPPTVLSTGTRDLYLSNTVRMHRALRDAHVRAELHVHEAGQHGGFPGGTPEGESVLRDIRRFLRDVLN